MVGVSVGVSVSGGIGSGIGGKSGGYDGYMKGYGKGYGKMGGGYYCRFMVIYRFKFGGYKKCFYGRYGKWLYKNMRLIFIKKIRYMRLVYFKKFRGIYFFILFFIYVIKYL